MQIHDALNKFSLQMSADGRSPYTILQYRRHVSSFIKWLTDTNAPTELTQITAESIAGFLASPAASTQKTGINKKSSSMNALRASLKAFFTFATRANWTTANPTYLLRRAKCSPRPPRSLTSDEQRKLLETVAAADTPQARRDSLLYHLLLATGIRIGSALAINWKDIDFARGELALLKTKGDQPETIPLPPSLLLHLKEVRGARISGPVFINMQGGRLSSRHAQRKLKYWVSAAGILTSCSPHSLRHSFAMNIYNSSHDLLLLKDAMRHRSVTSTQVYARAADTTVRRAIETVDPGAQLWAANTKDWLAAHAGIVPG
ncbi:MAG: tyrosine-type recombinase/integrase [Planctomycetota bacterium]